jgi:hypothetical protein
MSKTKWAVPSTDWVQLKQAIFRFGVSEEHLSSHLSNKPDLANEQLSKLLGPTIGATPVQFFSLRQLSKILEDKSGANSAQIDPSSTTFCILFSEGTTRRFQGTPWELLTKLPKRAVPDEMTFMPQLPPAHSVSYVDPAYRDDVDRKDRVRGAIEFVWCRLMLAAFSEAISREEVELYSRRHISSLHYERLPAHVWPLLERINWDENVAVAVDGSAFWSIYAERSASEPAGLLEARALGIPASDLKKASMAAIRQAITGVYDSAEAAGEKPPNIKELPAAVSSVLKAKGYRTTGSLVMKLGRDAEYTKRRRPRGLRLTSKRNS